MRSLISFFTLTYAVSWICFFAAAAISNTTGAPLASLATVNGIILLIGVFAPALVALALTALSSGRVGTVALLARTVQAPAQARWYVFAIGYFAAIRVGVVLMHRIIAGVWPAFGQTPFYVMLGATLIFTPVQAGEEIGWRGYALPRLAERMGLPLASIVLGVIWAAWHLPLFYIPGSGSTDGSFPVYLLGVTALSVVLTWLYWRTGGSLLMTMLMHAAINNTRDILAPPPPITDPLSLKTTLAAWLTSILLWLCAVYFLIRMRKATLQQSETNRTAAKVGAPVNGTNRRTQ